MIRLTIYVDNADELLNTCLEMTDWDVFIDDAGNYVIKLVEVTTDYILFCDQLFSCTETVKQYPNNKPCINSHLRKCIMAKHNGYGVDNYRYVKLQREVDSKITSAKLVYKDKI